MFRYKIEKKRATASKQQTFEISQFSSPYKEHFNISSSPAPSNSFVHLCVSMNVIITMELYFSA